MNALRWCVGIFTFVAVAMAFSDGPDPGFTGAPGEQTCALCHTGFRVNPDTRGRVSLEGIPVGYVPGERYFLKLSVTHPDSDRRRWGFQLTALTTPGNAPAGEFPVVGGNRGLADPLRTQRKMGGPGGQRQYMTHTAESTEDFSKRGGESWPIAWDAPATGATGVTFYAAGNAANGDRSILGDRIFTASFPISGALRFLEERILATPIARPIRAFAWGDFDGNGFPDLFLIGEGVYFLFRNDEGRLVDVTDASGIPRVGEGRAAAWADFDGDGRLDLYVVNEGQDFLLRQEGGGRFREVATSSGIIENAPGRAAAWGDFDGDGRLDLYVVNDGQDVLYRNDGGGMFVALDPRSAGLVEDAKGRAAAWGDFDGDGRLDLYVANEGPDFLYRNLGGGRFQNVAPAAGIVQRGISTAVAWFDFDGDGRLDLFVVREGQDILYRNRGDGTFSVVDPEVAGYANAGSGGVLAVADFDEDGRTDVFVAKAGGSSSSAIGAMGRSVGSWGGLDSR
ncbi:MAG: FG-GAP-like repeat-containing protein [Acidobacteriota bacterium]|nr:FG-GAP-like repeat-containing protein [Acidobacteriota bacterium]